MRNPRQSFIDKFHASPIKKRPITRDSDEHGPPAMIRYSNNSASIPP